MRKLSLNIMSLMATLGLDTSDYEKSVSETKASTKTLVSSLTKEYSELQKRVNETALKYNEAAASSGELSKEAKKLLIQLQAERTHLAEVQQALNNASTYMSSFEEKTKSTTESLAAAFAKAQLVTSAIQNIGRKVLDMGTSFVQSGMNYNAQIETYRIALTNMLGDTEKANAFLDKIKADAARTPFSTDSLVAANQYLLSAGENAEYSRKTILALGDAVKATGGGDDELNRMAQNLQQIANVGQASAVDIKQFAFAGINIYQVLADYTGKSVQDVQDMTITYDVLTQALQAAAEEGGRYYNAMSTQSQSLSGRMTTLQDNASQLAGKLTTGLSSAYGNVVSKANEWVTSILENDEKLTQLQNTITAVISIVTAAAASFAAYKASMAIVNTIEAVKKATEGVTLAQAAMNAVMAANPIAIVVTLLAGLATALATAYATSETFRDKVNGAFSSVKSVADSAIGWVINKVRGLISVVAGAISALDALKNGEGWEAAQNAYVNAYQSKINSYEMADERKRRQKLHNERVKQSQEAAKNAANEIVFSDLTGGGNGGSGGDDTSGKSSTTTAAQKIAQVIDSLTQKSHQAANGITTDIQEVTEKYDDGTEHITKTVTESGTEIVDGTARNYTTITKYIDGVQQKVEKTVEDIDNSVSAVQTRIDKNLSEAKSKWKSGILGTFQGILSDLKNGNWGNLGLTFAKLIWGEVSQDQREIISKWASDALTAINDAYSGGGLKAAYEQLQNLFTSGIAADATEAKTAVQSFGEILDGLGASGGVGEKLAGIATSFSSMSGSVISSLGGIVSFIAANPILAAILGITALAGGIGLSSFLKKKKSSVASSSASSTLSYKDIQDAYWYGNQRSFAGYDFMSDRYAMPSYQSGGKLTAYQEKMQASVDALYNVVQQYLPQAGNQVIKLDDGTLVGALAPSIDAQLGHLATLAERGN